MWPRNRRESQPHYVCGRKHPGDGQWVVVKYDYYMQVRRTFPSHAFDRLDWRYAKEKVKLRKKKKRKQRASSTRWWDWSRSIMFHIETQGQEAWEVKGWTLPRYTPVVSCPWLHRYVRSIYNTLYLRYTHNVHKRHALYVAMAKTTPATAYPVSSSTRELQLRTTEKSTRIGWRSVT